MWHFEVVRKETRESQAEELVSTELSSMGGPPRDCRVCFRAVPQKSKRLGYLHTNSFHFLLASQVQ